MHNLWRCGTCPRVSWEVASFAQSRCGAVSVFLSAQATFLQFLMPEAHHTAHEVREALWLCFAEGEKLWGASPIFRYIETRLDLLGTYAGFSDNQSHSHCVVHQAGLTSRFDMP